MKDSFKLFIVYFIFGMLMLNGIIKFNGEAYEAVSIGNAAFLVGALMLFIGLTRYLKKNNLFTLVGYSYKKFYEIVTTKNYSKETSKLKDYHDYLENREAVEEPYMAIVANGILFFLVAAYFVW